MSNTLYGTNFKWQELDDSSYNSPFLQNDEYSKCIMNVNCGGKFNKTLYLPVYPEDVTNSISTAYADASILGRPGTISAYNSTSDITTSFTLHMHREQQTFLTSGNSAKDLDGKNIVDKIVSLIESAQYPYLDENGSYTPIVVYKFGDTLIFGKQTSVQTKWSGPKIEGKYMEVTLNISVTNTPSKILTAKDIYESSPRGWGRFQDITTL